MEKCLEIHAPTEKKFLQHRPKRTTSTSAPTNSILKQQFLHLKQIGRAMFVSVTTVIIILCLLLDNGQCHQTNLTHNRQTNNSDSLTTKLTVNREAKRSEVIKGTKQQQQQHVISDSLRQVTASSSDSTVVTTNRLEKRQISQPAANTTIGNSSRRNDPWYLDPEPLVYPLKPYRFVYNVKGKNGQTEQYRREIGDGRFLSGSYGYILPDGIYRHVDYVADDRGFRAFIRTTEPGTANQNPADVVINSNPVPVYPIPGQNHFGTYSTALGAFAPSPAYNTTHLPLTATADYQRLSTPSSNSGLSNLVARFGSRTPLLNNTTGYQLPAPLYPLRRPLQPTASPGITNGGESLADKEPYSPVISYNRQRLPDSSLPGLSNPDRGANYTDRDAELRRQLKSQSLIDWQLGNSLAANRGYNNVSNLDRQLLDYNYNPYNSDRFLKDPTDGGDPTNRRPSNDRTESQDSAHQRASDNERSRQDSSKDRLDSANKLSYDLPYSHLPNQRNPNIEDNKKRAYDSDNNKPDLPLEPPPITNNNNRNSSSDQQGINREDQQSDIATGIKGYSGSGYLGQQHKSPTRNLFSGPSKTRLRMNPPYQEPTIMDRGSQHNERKPTNNMQPPNAIPRFDQDDLHQQDGNSNAKTMGNTGVAGSPIIDSQIVGAISTSAPPIGSVDHSSQPDTTKDRPLSDHYTDTLPRRSEPLFEPRLPQEPRLPLEPQAPLEPRIPQQPRVPVEPSTPVEPAAPRALDTPFGEPKAGADGTTVGSVGNQSSTVREKNGNNNKSDADSLLASFNSGSRDQQSENHKKLDNKETSSDNKWPGYGATSKNLSGTKGAIKSGTAHKFGLTTRNELADERLAMDFRNSRNTRMPDNIMMMNADWRSLQNTIGLPQPPRHDLASASVTNEKKTSDRNEANNDSNSNKSRSDQDLGQVDRISQDEVAYFDALRLSSGQEKLAQSHAERLSELEKFRQRLRAQQLLLDQARLGVLAPSTPNANLSNNLSSRSNSNIIQNSFGSDSNVGGNQLIGAARYGGNSNSGTSAELLKRSRVSSYLPNSFVSYDDDENSIDDESDKRGLTLASSLLNHNHSFDKSSAASTRKRQNRLQISDDPINAHNKQLEKNSELLSRVDSSKSTRQKLPSDRIANRDDEATTPQGGLSIEKEIERRFSDLAKKFQQNWPSIPSATQHLKAHLLASKHSVSGDSSQIGQPSSPSAKAADYDKYPTKLTVHSLMMQRRQQLQPSSDSLNHPNQLSDLKQTSNVSILSDGDKKQPQIKHTNTASLVNYVGKFDESNGDSRNGKQLNGANFGLTAANGKREQRARSTMDETTKKGEDLTLGNHFNMNLINSLTSLTASHINPFVSPSSGTNWTPLRATDQSTTGGALVQSTTGDDKISTKPASSIDGPFSTSSARYFTSPELLAATASYDTINNNNGVVAPQKESSNKLQQEAMNYATNHRHDGMTTSSALSSSMSPMSASSFENLAMITSEGSQSFENGHRSNMLDSLFSGQIKHLQQAPTTSQSNAAVAATLPTNARSANHDKQQVTAEMLHHQQSLNNNKESTATTTATEFLQQETQASSTTSNYHLPGVQQLPTATTPTAPMFSLTNNSIRLKAPLSTHTTAKHHATTIDTNTVASQTFLLGPVTNSNNASDSNRDTNKPQMAKNHKEAPSEQQASESGSIGAGSQPLTSLTSNVHHSDKINNNHRFIEVVSPIEDTNFQAYKDAQLSISAVSA